MASMVDSTLGSSAGNPTQQQHEVGGVQVVAAERLGEGVDPIAPAVAQDGLPDLVTA